MFKNKTSTQLSVLSSSLLKEIYFNPPKEEGDQGSHLNLTLWKILHVIFTCFLSYGNYFYRWLWALHFEECSLHLTSGKL